jgi:uncharacterized protein (DUF736 family)
MPAPTRARPSNLAVRPVTAAPPINPGGNDGPEFRAFSVAAACGVEWKQRPGKDDGCPSITVDAPSFPAPIYAGMIGTEGEELALIWSRRRAAE